MRSMVLLLLPIALAAGDTAKEQAAVKKVLDDQVVAWNKGDLEAFMAGYWKSEKLSFFSGDKKTAGWQATLDRYRAAGGRYEEHLLADCGHSPHLERPDEFLALVTGFLEDNHYKGRPVDVLQLKDGSMLISDDWNGAVYRVSYGKQRVAKQ